MRVALLQLSSFFYDGFGVNNPDWFSASLVLAYNSRGIYDATDRSHQQISEQPHLKGMAPSAVVMIILIPLRVGWGHRYFLMTTILIAFWIVRGIYRC